MWPEMSEYSNRYPALVSHIPAADRRIVQFSGPANGGSSFDWMLDYGIDGVFVNGLSLALGIIPPTCWPTHETLRTARVGHLPITYDMSGQSTNTLYSQLTNDWCWLVDNMHITQDPRYLHHTRQTGPDESGAFSPSDFPLTSRTKSSTFSKPTRPMASPSSVVASGGGRRKRHRVGPTCSGASTYIARGMWEMYPSTARTNTPRRLTGHRICRQPRTPECFTCPSFIRGFQLG